MRIFVSMKVLLQGITDITRVVEAQNWASLLELYSILRKIKSAYTKEINSFLRLKRS